MAQYVDGFIVPVPKSKVKAYLALAKRASKLWKTHGALAYVECQADDVKKGKWTSFPRAVKKKPTETVFFSWVIFKSRAHRDQVNKRVMKDPAFEEMFHDGFPFDGKRMIYGGFKTVVSV